MELTQEQIKELQKTQYLAITDLNEEKATPQLQQERRIVHWISTPTLDRVADRMMPKGCDSSKFEETKTVFIGHDYSRILGKNVKMNKTHDGVKVTTYFSKETQMADDEYRLHLEGVVNGWSIGFKPVLDSKTGMIKEGSIEWIADTNIRIFHEWELLEYSSTGIPANPECLDIAKSIVKSVEYKHFIEKTTDKLEFEKAIKSQSDKMLQLQELIEGLKTGNNIQEIQKEISEIKSKLETAGKANVRTQLFNAEEVQSIVAKSIVGAFSEFTGRKYKI